MEAKKERVYALLNGYLADSESKIVDGIMIEDEFLDGTKGANLVEEAYALKQRISKRLGVESDADLEHLIDCMEEISNILSLKMYEYGARLGE